MGHVLGDSGLRDIDPELQQLAMNAWRAPERVIAAHCSDQIADLGRDRRSADSTPARLPPPVETEAAQMPAHQRLRLEDDRGSEQGGEQPIEPNKNQPICVPQPERLCEKFILERHDSTSGEWQRCPAVSGMSGHSTRSLSRGGG